MNVVVLKTSSEWASASFKTKKDIAFMKRWSPVTEKAGELVLKSNSI